MERGKAPTQHTESARCGGAAEGVHYGIRKRGMDVLAHARRLYYPIVSERTKSGATGFSS